MEDNGHLEFICNQNPPSESAGSPDSSLREEPAEPDHSIPLSTPTPKRLARKEGLEEIALSLPLLRTSESLGCSPRDCSDLRTLPPIYRASSHDSRTYT